MAPVLPPVTVHVEASGVANAKGVGLVPLLPMAATAELLASELGSQTGAVVLKCMLDIAHCRRIWHGAPPIGRQS